MTGSENVSAESSDSGGNITRSEQPLVVMIIYAIHFCRADCQVVRKLTACSTKMITRLTVFVSDTYS